MFEKYSEYRDSGTNWLGKIPKGWDLIKAKYIWNEKIDLAKDNDEVLLSVSQYLGVNNREVESRSESLAGYKKVDQNDLVINIMLAWLGGLGLSSLKGVVSPAYGVYKLMIKADPRFLHYLYRTNIYLDEFARRSRGVVPSRWRMYTEDFGQVLTLLPSEIEQTAIANFLDRKTAQIDQAISIKEKHIELLKERRQILIHNAVTRGLDPDVKMKDSGVEWIGEIPEHWEVRRLKTFIKDLESGVSVNASESENAEINEIGVLKTSCVYNYIFEHFENKKVFESDLRRVSCPVKANTIIISRMNAPELVGASGYVSSEYPNLFLPDRLWQTVFHENCALNVLWLSKVFTVKGFRNCITAIANGSSPSMKNISKGDYLNLRVATPPVEEQDALVEYIEGLSQKIATAISLKLKEIEKLKEYKSTLINSAVTGKIKVS